MIKQITLSKITQGAVVASLSVLLQADAAYAAGSGMPWEGPLDQILTSLSGPVARRRLSSSYPDSCWPDPLSELIDQERRELFKGQTHFESFYYLTFVYLPPAEINSRLKNTFLESPQSKGTSYERLLTSYQAEIVRITDLMETLFSEVQQLTDLKKLSPSQLSYDRSVVNDQTPTLLTNDNPNTVVGE